MSKSSVVFLAGHGAVSGKENIVKLECLGKYQVTFPAQIKGQLCFVAHNILLQSLIKSNDPCAESEKIKTYHGVSTFKISGNKYFKLPSDVDVKIDLLNREQNKKLQEVLQGAKSIYNLLVAAEKVVKLDLLKLIPEDFELDSLQTGIFAQTRLSFCFGSVENAKKTIDIIEKFLTSNFPLEHRLGTWDKSMQMKPWQKDLPYSPASDVDSGYKKHTILSLSDKQIMDCKLSLHINENIINKLISGKQESKDQEKHSGTFQEKTYENGVLYLTTSASEPVLLSTILEILHKTHIYVSEKNDKISLISVYAHNPEEYSPSYIFGRSIENTTTDMYYDFTISEDASVVWGACRDVIDF